MQKLYYHTVNHHSTSTANARYHLDTDAPPGISPQHVVGCINHSIHWHEMIGIDQDHPLTVRAVGQDPNLDEQARALLLDEENGKYNNFNILSSTDQAQVDVTTSNINPRALVNNVVAILEPRLERIMCETLEFNFQKMQAIFLPPEPAPEYTQDQTFTSRRAVDLGLSIAKWEPNYKFNPNIDVIYVTIEHLNFDAFQAFIHELCRKDKLGWIYCEEIHKIHTDKWYRPVFRIVPILLRYGVPIICASATVPSFMQPEFSRMTGIKKWDVIRMRVSRPNVRLVLSEHADRTQAEAAFLAYAKERLAKYSKDERMMVFTRTVGEAKLLAAKFKTNAYYSRTDQEGKDENWRTFDSWVSKGEPKIIISTSLLGSGTDYAKEYETLCARDGPERQDMGDSLMQLWGADGYCLREPLSFFFDGSAETCITVGGEICSRCEDEFNGEPLAKPQRLSARKPPTPYVVPDEHSERSATPHHQDEFEEMSPRPDDPQFDSPGRAAPRFITALGYSDAPPPQNELLPDATNNAPVWMEIHETTWGCPYPHRGFLIRPKRTHLDPSTRIPEIPVSRLPRLFHRSGRPFFLVYPNETHHGFSSHVSRQSPIRIDFEELAHKDSVPPKTTPQAQQLDLKGNIVSLRKNARTCSQLNLPQRLNRNRLRTELYSEPSRAQLTISTSFILNMLIKFDAIIRGLPKTDPPSYRKAAPQHSRQLVSAPAVSTQADVITTDGTSSHLNPPYNQPPPPPPPPKSAPVARITQNPAQASAELVRRDIFTACCNEAMDLLRAGCAACWGRGYDNWKGHLYLNCNDNDANNHDNHWKPFKDTLRMPDGWCWPCLMPQARAGGKHDYVTNARECPRSNVMKPAVFAFLRSAKGTPKPSDCNFLPSNIPKGSIPDTAAWLLQTRDPIDPAPFLNIHHLFLWLAFKRKLIQRPAELRLLFPTRG
ncbi:hypothetical protein B0H14DRAFT_3591133 [Mycena olivaceomarginata]|nr:hypothetical protein B0H14DRAFT_3591133 [Mycena olivaceomarginata]